jgi:hypothetical protein
LITSKKEIIVESDYCPTPSQIKKECEKIQKTWSQEESLLRSGRFYLSEQYGWTAPQYVVHSRIDNKPGEKGRHIVWKRI